MSTNKQEYSKKYYLEHQEKIKTQSRINRKTYVKPRSAEYKVWMREYSKQHHLKTKYGLSIESLSAMVDSQSGKCAICSCELGRPMVDHDHNTGQIRGILCRDCNLLLGFAKESIEILTEAIKYVKAFKDNLT